MTPDSGTRLTILPAAMTGMASPVAEWMRQAAAIPGFGKR